MNRIACLLIPLSIVACTPKRPHDKAQPTPSELGLTTSSLLLTPERPSASIRFKGAAPPHVRWRSSDPSAISVGAAGRVQAERFPSSATIVAETDAWSSAPVVVVAAMPTPTLVLVDDAIVADVSPTDGGLVARMTVLPEGVEPGAFVIARGSSPLAGRVTRIVDAGDGAVRVEVERVPLEALFTDLVIDEALELVVEEDRSARGLSPPKCEYDVGGGVTFEVDTPDPRITSTMTLHYFHDVRAQRRDARAVGRVELDVAAAVRASLDFEGSARCRIDGATLKARAPGWLGLFVGVDVPLGIGVEVEAATHLASASAAFHAHAALELELALLCASGVCRTSSNATPTFTQQFDLTLPNPAAQFTASLGVYGFASSGLRLAPLWLPPVEVLTLEAGVAVNADASALPLQAASAADHTTYEARRRLFVTLGSDVLTLRDRLRADIIPEALLHVDEPFSSSPRGTFEASPSGDLTLAVEPGTERFLLLDSLVGVQVIAVEGGALTPLPTTGSGATFHVAASDLPATYDEVVAVTFPRYLAGLPVVFARYGLPDPCGAAGRWAASCPVVSACGRCTGTVGGPFGFEVPAAIAARGGTVNMAGIDMTFDLATCRLVSGPAADVCGVFTTYVDFASGRGEVDWHCKGDGFCECTTQVPCAVTRAR